MYAVGQIKIVSPDAISPVVNSGEIKFRALINGFSADVRIPVWEGTEKECWQMLLHRSEQED